MSFGRQDKLDREWGRGAARINNDMDALLAEKRPVCIAYEDRDLYFRDKYRWLGARRHGIPARLRNRCRHCIRERAIKNQSWCLKCRDAQHRRVLTEMVNRPWLSEAEKDEFNKLVNLWPVGREFKAIVKKS